MRWSMTATVRQAVSTRVQDIAIQVRAEDVEAATPIVRAHVGDATVAQIIDPTGRVAVASASLTGEPPLVAAGAAPTGVVVVGEVSLAFADDAPYLVASERVPTESGVVTVVAAQAMAPVDRIVRTVVVALGLAAPLLLAAVGVATWMAVGRSLTSVDRIRRRVESIDALGLHERVPVPDAKDEVEHLAVTMNRMLDRLQSAMRQQQQFVADASHELKSPLATLRTSVEAAEQAGRVDATTARVLVDQADRMATLVADLLTLAQADERGADDTNAAASFVDVDVDDVVAEAVAYCHDARVRTVLWAEPVRMRGDRPALVRAVRNLVENATRHATTTVQVRVARRWEQVVVTVDDDGPGVAEADRARVFDRFVRVDRHRARTQGGSGLGLAIVREIATAHAGSVRVGDSPLGGAQFTLTLPCVRAQAGGDETGSRR